MTSEFNQSPESPEINEWESKPDEIVAYFSPINMAANEERCRRNRCRAAVVAQKRDQTITEKE